MNVLVAGPGRCASTAQYNAVRLMLEKTFGKDNIFADNWVAHSGKNNDPTSDKEKTHNVVKHHWPSEKYLEWADIIFTARRCLLDTMASDKRATGCTNTKEMIYEKLAGTILCHEWWWPESTYEVSYEDWRAHPQEQVDQMADIMEACCDKDIVTEGIVEEVNGYTNTSAQSIPNSCFGCRQRTDGRIGSYKDALECWEIDFVLKWGAWYQRKYNYRCS